CDGGTAASVDLAQVTWEKRGPTDLYSLESRPCRTQHCVALARRALDTTFSAARDVLHTELLDHIWIHVPLAVWSDGAHTLPQTPAWVQPASLAPDAAQRIATLASAWAVLFMFYPGFQDQQTDWVRELPGALTSGATARSTRDTYIALSRLTA